MVGLTEGTGVSFPGRYVGSTVGIKVGAVEGLPDGAGVGYLSR